LSVLAAGAADASALAGVAAGADVPPEPPLKSVAYQPFELKARSGELFGKGGFATRRTFGQWGIGNLLQDVLGMAAGPAFVGINGHGARVR
jgi:hypothetical protein